MRGIRECNMWNPNPNSTLDASGEQKLISKSGPFFSIFFVNNLLSKLANKFTLKIQL